MLAAGADSDWPRRPSPDHRKTMDCLGWVSIAG
ncbi:hypothetical protein BH160DRAFT_3918 [Burkholderia sp. H160]|nr:hypothetical protein BH160DRAFT_3918 [Burkholderia sp. H160]